MSVSVCLCVLPILQLTTLCNLDSLSGLACLCAHLLNLAHNVHALLDVPKHDVLAVQPLGLLQREEELAAVGVSDIGWNVRVSARVCECECLCVYVCVCVCLCVSVCDV